MNRLVATEVSVVRRNARAWLGLVEHDNDAPVNDDGYAYEGVSEVQDDDEIPSDQLAMGNGIQIAVVRPRNFRDAATVGEYFRQEIPVIINLEDVDNAGATRIIDFVSGLILGRCGDIERLSRRTFLIVPAGATILTTHDGLTDESFFNQALQPVNDSPGFSRIQRRGHLSFEVEYGAQCDVDLHEFFRVQASREVAEALRVDGGGLLDQYPDILAEEFDGGMDLTFITRAGSGRP